MTGDFGGGRRVMVGALWTYGAQVTSILFQFSYAAIVSRMAGPEDFGLYSISLSITALISLLASGGMSQAVARLMEVEKELVGSLASFAWLLGLTIAVMTFLTAGFWTALWGTPEATETVQWLSVSAVLAPMFSLLSGLARRTGQFSKLAKTTVVSNVVGMVLGVGAVAYIGGPSSLVVSAVAAQLLIVLWLGRMFRHYLVPRSLSAALPHVAFSSKLVAAGLLQYAVGNVGKLSATRFFGAAPMGQWNRAEVLTTIPMQQIQSAMVQAIYPEFRHDIGSSQRAKQVWADMLILVAWLSVPASMALVVLAPTLIPLILGDEWKEAAAYAVPLSFGVALQPVSVLLASALESLGKFQRIWATDLVLLLLQVGLVIWMVIANEFLIVVWGIALTNSVRLIIHCVIATRIGYLDAYKFCKGMFQVLVTSAFVLAGGKSVEWLVLLDSPDWTARLTGWGIVSLLMVLILLGVKYSWRKLPPVRLGIRYGLLPSKE